jgi:hypothetical protein
MSTSKEKTHRSLGLSVSIALEVAPTIYVERLSEAGVDKASE